MFVIVIACYWKKKSRRLKFCSNINVNQKCFFFWEKDLLVFSWVLVATKLVVSETLCMQYFCSRNFTCPCVFSGFLQRSELVQKCSFHITEPREVILCGETVKYAMQCFLEIDWKLKAQGILTFQDMEIVLKSQNNECVRTSCSWTGDVFFWF